MLSEQRLSVTFGAFSCDVVGYDDPFRILNRVVELFTEIAKDNPEFGSGAVGMTDMERARVAAGLADQAGRIDEMADASTASGARYVVTNQDALPEVAEEPAEEEVFVADVSEEVEGVAADLELRDTLDGLDAAQDEAELNATITETAAEIAPLAIAPTLELNEEAPSSEDDAAANAEIEQDIAAAFEAPLDEAPVLEEVATAEVAEIEEALEVVSDDASPILEEAVVEENIFDEDPADEAVAEGMVEETAVAAEPEAEEPSVEEIAAAEPIAEDAVEAVAEAPVELVAEPEVAEEALEEVARDEAQEPARRPLRLEIPSVNLTEQTPEASEKTAEADAPVETAEAAPKQPAQKKPRVSVTRLPRNVEAKTDDAETAKRPATLTPVQKVEPVVTLSASIAESAVAAADSSRADRIRAKMERRNQEDEGDNFLFADVGEAVREADVDAEAARHDDVLPLRPAEKVEMQAEETDEAEEEKKPRRSLAGLLGFGRNAKAKEDEPVNLADVATPAPSEPAKPAGQADGFDRLRESVAAAMPVIDEPKLDLVSSQKPETISEAIDYDDETSPTAFARRVGATTLQDLLEVSAVYMAVVEGKSKFSRRDVMQALNQIGADKDYTQEARLKSFRKLLTSGSLVRVDDGLFTVSQATRFGYETQLQA